MALAHPGNRARGSGRPDPEAGLAVALARLEAVTGYRLKEPEKIIPDAMTFRAWCEKLAGEGLKVDGKPFRLDNRPAMAWLYDQIPATREQSYRHMLVLMKCAQVGFTVMEILAAIYLGLKFGPCTVGMFLPDVNLAGIKSSERFMPMVRSVPEVHALMTQDAADGSGRKSGEGNVTRRRLDEALFIFSWTSGRATTESIPMDFLNFDEVQEMTLAQMEKTMERMSASDYRFALMGSTANWPELDIHHWYKLGTQHRFHTECPTCGARKPLDEYFPDCIRWDPQEPDPLTRRPGVHRYVCEQGHWIDDTQQGEWIPENPDAWIVSAHFHQMLSPTITASEIMQKYTTSTDKKNFFNRVLGKPYLDPTQIPVTLEHMARCVEHGKAAGVRWKRGAKGAFMGIDQMGAYNFVIIKERLPDGRQAVIHVEEVYSLDPFGRCDELMAAYGIAVCVVEVNPNFNDAQRFATRHPGRVFLCNGFGSLADDMVKWGDAPSQDVSERRTDDEYRTRYTVKADQFRCMQASLARFTALDPLTKEPRPNCLWPDPKELAQEVIDNGVKSIQSPASRAFVHFTKTALVSEKDDDTNSYRRVVRKVGCDPHASYANQLCDVAWARAHGTASFVIPDGTAVSDEMRTAAEARNLHGLPTRVAAMMEALHPGTCGGCTAFPIDDEGNPLSAGRCSERAMLVAAKDPACEMFIEAG